MKVEMTKHDMIRIVDSGAIEILKAAGWMTKSPVPEQTQAEDVITLKPTARARAAVKDAQGDTSNSGE